MKVVVTQDHIDRGLPARAQLCPIALALNEQHGNGHYVMVSAIDYSPNGWQTVAWYHMPPEASQFVRDFDHDRPVQPFEFEVEPTDL